jgi:uncharacterized integral membrane protein
MFDSIKFLGVFLIVGAMAYALLGMTFHFSVSGIIFLGAIIAGVLLIISAILLKVFTQRRNHKRLRRKM